MSIYWSFRGEKWVYTDLSGGKTSIYSFFPGGRMSRGKNEYVTPVCRLEKLEMWDAQTSHLGQVVQFFFWRTTSRQAHQIRLVYTTDNFFKRLGPYIMVTHSPVALPFHPIPGKRRERLHDVLPIQIHCRVIWRRNWRCLGLSWKMYDFCSVAKKQAHIPSYFL